MTTPGSGYLVLIANWTATAINVPNAYGAAWAEIGYGYNMIYPGHGPDWYYYYFRVDGSDGWYYPLSPNPSPDLTRHTIKIWWSSSNTYRGSVDDVEVMFATGLSSGTEGVYWHFVGAETNTCRSSISSSYISELKGQNWSGSWTSWLSGVIEEQAPANADWESQPLSGWVSIN
jgi:hypothetical protein